MFSSHLQVTLFWSSYSSWENITTGCDFQNNYGLLFHLVPSRVLGLFFFFVLIFLHMTGVSHLVENDNNYANFGLMELA